MPPEMLIPGGDPKQMAALLQTVSFQEEPRIPAPSPADPSFSPLASVSSLNLQILQPYIYLSIQIPFLVHQPPSNPRGPPGLTVPGLTQRLLHLG